ncbi:MAG: serine/threonine-protein kinase [Polyangia bacterium]
MDTSSEKLSPGTPAQPTPFGKYLLMGLIARGGMAEVYRARKRSEGGQLYAIKCMRPQLAKEARFVEMFVREGKLAEQLKHPSVVRTFEIGRTDGRYYISMEYIGGKDLTQILRRCQDTGGRIPTPHACFIAARMAEGLHFAHTLIDPEGKPLSVIHRDVSPSNVRIGYDGDVKLLDFGIAQAMVKFTSEIGVLKGKFSYMSPEQIRGMPVDARTDVFSTGIVLHEMLTTEKLFRGDTEFQLMERVRNAEVLPPSKFNRRVPEALDRIVLKALARDVADRYPSALDLAADLNAFLDSYKFKPTELQALVRELFRADYEAEMQELQAAQRAALPVTIEERESSLVLNPQGLANAVSSGVPLSVPSVTESGSIHLVAATSGEMSGAISVSRPEMPAAAAQETAPISSPSGPEASSNPELDGQNRTNPNTPKGGLWARLVGRFRSDQK